VDAIHVEVREESLRTTTSQLRIRATRWLRFGRWLHVDVDTCGLLSVELESSTTVASVCTLDVLTMSDTADTWLLQAFVDVSTHIPHESVSVGTFTFVSTICVNAFLNVCTIVFTRCTFILVDTLGLVLADNETLGTNTLVTTRCVLAGSRTFGSTICTFVLVFALLSVHGELVAIVAHAPETLLCLHALAVLADTHHVTARVLWFHHTTTELLPQRCIWFRTGSAIFTPGIGINGTTTLCLSYFRHLLQR